MAMERLAKEYKNVLFESSCYETEQFKSFVRKAKGQLKKGLTEEGLTLTKFNKGHFEISGFILNEETGKYAYFIIGDMRWKCMAMMPLDSVLVRTAEGVCDYHGGHNNFCKVTEMVELAKKLTA
jgi:hypothetical protein